MVYAALFAVDADCGNATSGIHSDAWEYTYNVEQQISIFALDGIWIAMSEAGLG